MGKNSTQSTIIQTARLTKQVPDSNFLIQNLCNFKGVRLNYEVCCTSLQNFQVLQEDDDFLGRWVYAHFFVLDSCYDPSPCSTDFRPCDSGGKFS